VREALLGRAFAESGLIDGAEVTALLDQHQSGQRDHAAVLWSLLMLESFLRQVHQSAARPAVGGDALPLGMVAAS
jgi:asparagine synthase (glutamine-hydrolysing)